MTMTDRQAKKEAWIEHVKECEASGLGGAKWCTAPGFQKNRLSYWRRKLKRQQPEETRSLALGHWRIRINPECQN